MRPVSFVWHVCKEPERYQIAHEGLGGESPYLVDWALGEGEGSYDAYAVIDDSSPAPRAEEALFPRFAMTYGDPDRVLEFCREFGVLGIGSSTPLRSGEHFYAEPLDWWRYESAAMRIAFRAFTALLRSTSTEGFVFGSEDGDEHEVGLTEDLLPEDLFEPDVIAPWSLVEQPEVEWNPYRPGGFSLDDIYEEWGGADGWWTPRPGWDVVKQLVGNRLRKHCGISFEPLSEPPVDDGARGVSPLRVVTRPKHLLGALWLEVAFALEGEFDYGKCPLCETYWAKTRDSRANRKWCKMHEDEVGNMRKSIRRKLAKGKEREDVAREVGVSLEGLDAILDVAPATVGKRSWRDG